MSDKQGKSIFGFIKDAFVESVPDGEPQVAAPPPTRNTPLPPLPLHAAQHAVVADPRALQKLEENLQAIVPPAYASFMEQFEQLKEVIPDDTMRFKAALKTSKTSVEQLSADLDQLLAGMTKAHSDFEQKFEAQHTKVVGAIQDAINSTTEQIKNREAQKKAIEEEIVTLQSKLGTDGQHMHDEEVRLSGVRQGFEAAYTQVVGRLSAQRTKIASMATKG